MGHSRHRKTVHLIYYSSPDAVGLPHVVRVAARLHIFLISSISAAISNLVHCHIEWLRSGYELDLQA